MNEFLTFIQTEFSKVNGFENKYMLLLKLARNGEFLSQDLCNDEHEIKGCEAKVWLSVEQKEGKYYFLANSDSRIIKSIVWIITNIANDASQKQSIDFVAILLDLGLSNVVSQSRQNGIANIQKHIENVLNIQ